MRCSADRLIEALIKAQMIEYQHQAAGNGNKQQPHIANVVTISRECGSLGKEVAQLLADALEVRCCDRIILQEVARRADVDEKLVEVLDQHVSQVDDWWQHFLHGEKLTYEEYYEYLVKTVVSISRMGGVILGRGANILLGPEKAFRVRVTGSLEHCASVISRQEQVDMEQAKVLARQANRERAEYIRRLYDADINDLSHYDLVLNSDRFTTTDMVELILQTMDKAGYRLPADAMSSVGTLSELSC